MSEGRSQLEKLRELISNRQKLTPVARPVDAHVEAVDPGIVTAYADMAMAMAAHTLCAEGKFLATSQLSISFLLPVTKGPVFGDGVELARATSVGTARRIK